MSRKLRLQEMLVITQYGLKKKKINQLLPYCAHQMLQYSTVLITGKSILNTYVNL